MYAVRTQKLTKYYGKSRGIIDVDLEVKKGDFFGFIGPNGAGKSTAIRTLLGMIYKTSGTAEVLGMNIESQRNEILAKVGYLPSEVSFYYGMRALDAIKLSARLRGKDCSAEADMLCERLMLDSSKKISELSLGNRKKVGIVCALQHKPELYVLDEPTSGLDPIIQRELYAILKERNEQGATVLLSTHVLSEIGRYCNRAAIIREGRILVSESVENLSHTGAKKVILRGVMENFKIQKVKNLKQNAESVEFLYDGSPKELIRELRDVHFSDVNISDPDLEDIILNYYERSEEK